MKRSKLLVLSGAMVALSGIHVAQAGILSLDVSGSSQDYFWASIGNVSAGDFGGVAVDSDPQPVSSLTLTSGDAAPAFNVDMGLTIGDPTLFVMEVIQNNTAQTWGSYKVTISPLANLMISNVVINPFGIPNLPLPVGTFDGIDTVTFSGGTVGPGQTLTLDFSFDVNPSDVGNYDYKVTNNAIPVPEPATLSVLGLGVLALLRRRR